MHRPFFATSLLILLASAASAQTAAPTADDRDLLGARSKGNAAAPIRVVEMSDFQCPWCRKFTMETAAALDSEYVATGKVHWIFVNLPIPPLHPNAAAAAELAMCAAEHGKFWPMHDLLFRNQDQWAPLRDPEPFLLTLVDSLRLPRDSVVGCLQQGGALAIVQRDAAAAARIGATSTPSFLIEGALVTGAYPVEVFRHILDSIYAVRQTTPRH